MINPVRLKGKPGNIARYYTVGDYYTKGADEHSEWGGKIATELGLEGSVDRKVFKELLAGKVGDQQLGRHRRDGEIHHHPGWDFAVSAPKSVSIMALVAGDDRIIAAHERAVTAAVNYLEEHATLRRRDGGEIIHETTGRLIFARFTEYASRELDPHLHTHVVVMNMTNREDGAPMASLETRAMYAEQMTAGQVYRNELAYALRELGHEIEHDPRSGLFEIKGVPSDLIKEYSRRAEQVDAHAKEHGFVGQAERQRSFYATRPAKVKVSLDTLHQQWAERSQPHRDILDGLKDRAEEGGQRAFEADPISAGRAALFGIRQAEVREAVNNRGRILRLGLASHVGEVRIADLQPRLDDHEARRKLLATHALTGDQVLTRGRTTRRTARMEQALGQHLALALDDARPIASADRLLIALENAGLKPAQERALVQVATTRDRVTGIHGVGGAGKSTLVKTLNEAAEPGMTLLALAPTSSAAANLGKDAGIESRTVASLLASGGHGLTDRDVLVLDEAGQLGNRQALRVLEISRATGARVLLLGDNKQTGAIEQGKAFWLLQKLGLPTAQLTESMRQKTAAMKTAVTRARGGDYAGSLSSLDKVVSGAAADQLAKSLVAEWTRLNPENRAKTNILVLDNATRQIVNTQIHETLKREGVVAAEDTRLSVLTPSGMTDEEKHNARFYSGGQVVTFGRDIAAAGIARNTEYRVVGIGRDANGRQVIRLADENGRIIRWDPRLGPARQVNVFNREERDLAQGDRIQWRLASKDLQLKNAERGTVEGIVNSVATIRWDRDGRVQTVDLASHKTWDHGYAETVYSAQSKTYDRVYVLAPVSSGLVNGQNYYTAITRAQFGVKLWTEDAKRLSEKLAHRSGEKTSALEGLDRLNRDEHRAFAERHPQHIRIGRQEHERSRQERRDRALAGELSGRERSDGAIARSIGIVLDRFLRSVLDRNTGTDRQSTAPTPVREDRLVPTPSRKPEPSRGDER
jgi:conjugative relaxase-like TrwC/TraI family protein